jgi:hypothetical protein
MNPTKDDVKLSNQDRSASKRSPRNIAPLLGGSILILLVAAGGWYFFNPGKQSTPDASVRTTASLDGAAETGSEVPAPEGVPEGDAPGTPSPGFADNFEEGLGPEWTVHYGDPFSVDGRLTSNVGAGIAAGDASWKNYQIEFDVDTSRIDCSFVDTSNSLGVRVQDFDHAYWFVFTKCNSAWSLFVGGFPDLLPETAVNSSNDVRHITIKVNGTQMSALENGSPISSINDPSLHTGGIFLQIEAQTFYDNFQVTLLP